MLSLETFAAYCRTSYQADTPAGSFVLRVSRRRPEFDAWVRSAGFHRWMLITAWNPRSTELPAEENSRRHERLVARVDALGLPRFPSRGLGDDPAWAPEEGLLILGASRADAVALAAEFEQHAIVFGDVGEPAELLFPFRGEVEAALRLAQASEDPAVAWTARRALEG